MTETLLPRLPAAARNGATPVSLELDDLGAYAAWYLDLAALQVAQLATAPRRSLIDRFVNHVRMTWRSLPYFTGKRTACVDFRNVGPQK